MAAALPYIAMGLTAVGGAQSANAAASQQEAAINEAVYNQEVANINADILDRQADDIIARGPEQIRNIRERRDVTIGAQRAAIGASGVDVGSGTALDVFADTEGLAARDIETAQYNIEQAAYEKRVQAYNVRQQSGLYGLQAASYDPAGARQAGLLTAGAQVAGQAATYQNLGAFS